jgi:hypothetical protein
MIWTKTNEVIHRSVAIDRHSDCTELRWRRSPRKERSDHEEPRISGAVEADNVVIAKEAS